MDPGTDGKNDELFYKKTHRPFSPCWMCPSLTQLIYIALAFHVIVLGAFAIVFGMSAPADRLSLPIVWTQLNVNVTTVNATDVFSYAYKTEKWIDSVPISVYAIIFISLTVLEHLIETIWAASSTSDNKRSKFIVDQIMNKRNIVKCVFFTLSAPFLLVAITHVSGVVEFSTLFFTWGLVATVLLFGLCIDFIEYDHYTARWLTFFSGWIPFVFAWIIPIVAVAKAPAVPVFVQVLVAVEVVMFSLFGLNMAGYVFGWYRPANTGLEKKEIDAIAYSRYTYLDVIMSFIAKFASPVIIFASTVSVTLGSVSGL
jgi:hypothetical protein